VVRICFLLSIDGDGLDTSVNSGSGSANLAISSGVSFWVSSGMVAEIHVV
jgi:hypothetical protein